jgi:uncharacterized membrane protein HdeD (DUF308 family)
MTDVRDQRLGRDASSWWWVFLVTGGLWLILSLIILRMNTASITTVAILFGSLAIVAGINEVLIASAVTSWRWVHIALGVLFVVTGIIALFNPGATFWALASIIGWFLLFKGTFDIIMSILTRPENELWWLGLVTGILEVLVAFWAAGGFGRKFVLLIIWAAAAALARGITEIVTAFRLRGIRSTEPTVMSAASAGMPPGPGRGQR